MSRWRLLPAAFAIASGLAMVLVSLSFHGPSASRDADRLLALFRPALTDKGLAQMRSDLTTGQHTADALVSIGLPILARANGQSEVAFVNALPQRYPALALALQRRPEITALTNSIISNLEQRQGEFAAADRLPGPGLTFEQALWVTMGIGAALVVLGLLFVLNRATTPVALVLLVLSAALVALPLVEHYPSRMSKTADLLDALKPYGTAKTQPRVDALNIVTAGITELRDRAIPDAAGYAGRTSDSLVATMTNASPDLKRGLTEIDSIVGRFAALIRESVRSQPLLASTDRMPVRNLMWLYLGPGIAILVGLVPAVLAGRIGVRRYAAAS